MTAPVANPVSGTRYPDYPDYVGWWHSVAATQSIMLCDLNARTQAESDEAVRYLRWQDRSGLLSFAVASRGAFAALCADIDTAQRFLDEYDDLFRRDERKTTALADRGRGWLAFQRGHGAEARQWAIRAYEAAWDNADVSLWAAPLAHDLARFGAVEAAIERLVYSQRRLHSPFTAALLDQCQALADDDLDRLLGATEALACCNAQALAAEGLLQGTALASGGRSARLAQQISELLKGSLLRSPVVATWLRQLDQPRPAEQPRLALARGGTGWRVEHDGVEAWTRDLTGFAHLAVLVANPGKVVRAATLMCSGDPPPRASRQHVLDETARQALEARARALVADLQAARRRGAQALVEQLEAEADEVTTELLRQRSLSNAGRAFPDTDERARTAVRKAIARAFAELDELHPAAAQYLRAHVSTGTLCEFRP